MSAAGPGSGEAMSDRLRAMSRGEVPPPPVGKLIGMDLTEVGDGEATFELVAGPQHANPMGTLHGGILCDLADGAMGVAYASGLGADETFTTLELKMNFLRPFWTGRLTAHAKIVSAGRTIGLVECRITDGEGRAIAHATSTCMTLRGHAASGR